MSVLLDYGPANPMQETFHVRLADDRLIFSAAHFLALGPDGCERLHGHNYRAAAEVSGPLDASQCVVDFFVLREELMAVLGELDHRVLLPGRSPSIRVAVHEQEVVATFGDRRWVFPLDDCVVLPVVATTAELLARHVGQRLVGRLEERTGLRPAAVRIEIEESPGQSAVYVQRAED
jgi:6-pyruvoyltetrahydropterin/6-carboxytetrahydropterin synthase